MSASVYMPIILEGETVEVLVARDGEVWRAYATFRGAEIEARDSSMSAALEKWRAQANEAASK